MRFPVYPAYILTTTIFIISGTRLRCAVASENDCVVIITIVLSKSLFYSSCFVDGLSNYHSAL